MQLTVSFESNMATLDTSLDPKGWDWSSGDTVSMEGPGELMPGRREAGSSWKEGVRS